MWTRERVCAFMNTTRAGARWGTVCREGLGGAVLPPGPRDNAVGLRRYRCGSGKRGGELGRAGPSLAVNSGSVDYLIACLEGESVVVQRAAGTSLTPPLRTPWTQQKGRARYYGHALVSCVSAGVYIRPHGVWGDVTSTGAGCGRWGSIIRAVFGLS
jgi:hypothetical protein